MLGNTGLHSYATLFRPWSRDEHLRPRVMDGFTGFWIRRGVREAFLCFGTYNYICTTLPCVELGLVDWVIRGRCPRIQVCSDARVTNPPKPIVSVSLPPILSIRLTKVTFDVCHRATPGSRAKAQTVTREYSRSAGGARPRSSYLIRTLTYGCP